MEEKLAWAIIIAGWLLMMVAGGVLAEIIYPWAKRQLVDWLECRRVLKASGLPRRRHD